MIGVFRRAHDFDAFDFGFFAGAAGIGEQRDQVRIVGHHVLPGLVDKAPNVDRHQHLILAAEEILGRSVLVRGAAGGLSDRAQRNKKYGYQSYQFQRRGVDHRVPFQEDACYIIHHDQLTAPVPWTRDRVSGSA